MPDVFRAALAGKLSRRKSPNRVYGGVKRTIASKRAVPRKGGSSVPGPILQGGSMPVIGGKPGGSAGFSRGTKGDEPVPMPFFGPGGKRGTGK